MAYTVLAGLESEMIDIVVVSTDYENIRQVAIQYGAEALFLRPDELSTDTSHTPDVVEHAVAYYENEFKEFYDIIVTLQPTSPFRTGHHIDEAVEKFINESTLDSLISVKKQDYPPWWMFQFDGNLLKPFFPYKEGVNVFNLERQEFPPVYRPNGAIYVCMRKYLAEFGGIVNPKNNGYYLMKAEESIDIDNMADLYTARYELKERSR